jgi:septal ring factor EnvC (AmiA/AmiB activator)
VRELEQELAEQNDDLQVGLSELGRLRDAKQGELAELRQIESEHQRTLQQFRTQETRSISRMDELDEDEASLRGLLVELDRRRIEEERRRAIEGGAVAGATMSTADIGRLDWPVQGDLAYTFGVERRPNGTVLRWNGVGIRAPVGTPVHAVRAGTVLMAGALEGYGPSVVLSHGGGFYTLYLYLEEIGVIEGGSVGAGQVVGTVGGQGTPEGPRLEFQIRAPVGDGIQQAMDPIRWLRPRNGRP